MLLSAPLPVSLQFLAKISCLSWLLAATPSYAWMVDGQAVQTAPSKLLGAKTNQNITTLPQKTFDHESLKRSLTKAQAQFKVLAAANWSHVERSNSHQWVIYHADWQEKTVLDFKQNEIRITLLDAEDSVLSAQALERQILERKMLDMLSMRLDQAISQDNVFVLMEESEREKWLSMAKDSPLVFSELFKSDQPSADEIRELMQQLVAKARKVHRGQSQQARFKVTKAKSVTYEIPLPQERLALKAREFAPIAQEFGDRLAVPPALILAIMHTESHFNPLAKSYIPAFGLMQIVPKTAGMDAAQALFEQPPELSPGYLYNPRNNIELGSAYVHLLYYQYLAGIRDPVSRMYVAIAAYNGGASSVARAFISRASMQQAIPNINRLSARAVLDKLKFQSPSQETRNYVNKVLKWKAHYEAQADI